MYQRSSNVGTWESPVMLFKKCRLLDLILRASCLGEQDWDLGIFVSTELPLDSHASGPHSGKMYYTVQLLLKEATNLAHDVQAYLHSFPWLASLPFLHSPAGTWFWLMSQQVLCWKPPCIIKAMQYFVCSWVEKGQSPIEGDATSFKELYR